MRYDPDDDGDSIRDARIEERMDRRAAKQKECEAYYGLPFDFMSDK